MQKALINPRIIRWAIETRNISEDTIAKKLHKKIEDVAAWIEGKEKPTFKQAQKLAKILEIPFGYLYLKNPPEEKLPVPDFRTVKNKKPVSSNIKKLLLQLEQKQLFLEDFFRSEGYEPLDFIGKFNTDSNYKKIAEEIRNWLEIPSLPTKDILDQLLQKFIENRIFVFRNSVLGTNNREKIDIEEIRGAVYVNKYAPIIYINENDSKKAQIFTLIHEFVHILINQSEFSDIQITSSNRIEQFCNKVTAEVLLPEKEIRKLPNQIDLILLDKISNRYNISKLAALYKLLNTNKIDRYVFEELYGQVVEEYQQIELMQRKKKSRGGDFYKTYNKRYGNYFIKIVKYAIETNKITYREAQDILNVKLKTIYNILEKV